MDPQARHSTWTVLQKFKQEKQCSILLTTHFMDEADFLGDRIAIMSRGSLRCCGSPLYLKSKYDSGYNLVINKKTSNKTSKAINDDPSVNKFMSIIQKHVQNAQLNSNINNEISFMLPKEQTPKFAALFSDLEQYKEELNIINVGVSVTTVEEVFLKIGDLEECEELDAVEESTLNNNVAILDVKTTDDFGLYAGVNAEERNDSIFFKYYQQFYGLLVLPIVSLLFALVLLKFGPISLKDSASLPISLKPYRSNYVPFKVFGGNDSLAANLSTAYQNQFDSNALDLNFGKLENCSTSTNDIDNYMTCIGQLPNVGISLITDNYIVGATFETNGSNITKITGHFNNQPYHAPPLTLNLITNSILKMRTNSPKAQINVINHPMPRTLDEEATEERGLGVVGGFQISGMITIGFSFLIASFASFLIKERVSNAKHMQYLTGANPVVFWISNLAWDFVNYLVPAVICILLIVLFDVKQLGGSQLQYMFGLFFLYGWANIPLTYLLAYIFKSPSTGFAIIVILYLLTSQASIVAVNVLTLPGIDLKDVADVLEWLFLILLPNFSFGQGITDIYQNYEFTGICKKVIDQLPPNIPLEFACLALPNPCCIGLESGCGVDDKNKPIPCLPWNKNYMAWEKPGLGRYFTFMTLQFVVLFSLVFIYELGLLRKIFYVIKTLFCSSPSEESQNIDIHYKQKAEEELFGDIQKDSDVLEEENRIKTEKNDLLCIDQLTKYYGDFMAVKGISVGIQPGECFGLLGVNGAGKTTTFKMITGDELITKGDVLLNRTSIKRDINTYQKQIGYCPQFDPLIERMTTLETLYLFARLRGIKENLIKRTCLSIISMLDLSDHTEKMVQTLSGGNKRKLSVGIALIGSPKIVLLDEPTSGMDPRTRRFLWNCLNNIREKGKSLILTSHSMEETEALCTRMGIMVNGELKCLGNLQHLKSVYGEGYTLLVKITQTQKEINKVANSFIQTVKSKFANSILKENRDGFVNIQILDNSIRMLGSIFTLIEDIKVEYSIEYYFVTQTKLEQIFLNFAGKQIEPSSRYLANKKACLFC